MNQTHGDLIKPKESDARPFPYSGDAANNSSTKVDSSTDFQHYVIVSNKRSGSSRGDDLARIVQEKAAQFDKLIDFVELEGDVESQIDQAIARGAQALIAAGGDGTVSSLATLAFRKSLAFGVIPSGTANLFARELSIPLQAEEALDLILQTDRPRPVDLILIEQRVYLCHISVGTYTSIGSQTQTAAKKKYGRFAYIWRALRLLKHKRLWTFRMEVDGKAFKRRASTLMITNVGAMGAGELRWTPDAKLDDGIVEICVIRARSLRHYLELFASYMLGREHPHLQETIPVHQGAHIKVSRPLPIHGDGEDIAKGDFSFEVRPQALKVLVGDRKADRAESLN